MSCSAAGAPPGCWAGATPRARFSTADGAPGRAPRRGSTPPLATAGGAAAAEAAQARAMRGPRADPRAVMLIKPYLKLAVYVEVTGEHQERPYWLIGTRRPAELAAAIEG